MLQNTPEHHFSASIAVYPFWRPDGLQLILARRRDGQLCPVGGHIEPGEDFLAAIKREWREETGTRFNESIKLLDPSPFPINHPGYEKTSLGFVYVGEYLGVSLPVSRGDPDIQSLESLNGKQLRHVLLSSDTALFRPEMNYPTMLAVFTEIFPKDAIADVLYSRATEHTARLNASY